MLAKSICPLFSPIPSNCLSSYLCPLLYCRIVCVLQWKSSYENTVSAIEAVELDVPDLLHRVNPKQLSAVSELKAAMDELEVSAGKEELEFLCGEAHCKLHIPMCQVCT